MENLLVKLANKLKNAFISKTGKRENAFPSKTSKRAITSLVLAGALVATMVGCTYTPSTDRPVDPDNPIVDPINPDNPNPNPDNPDPTEQYSDILRAVLNDPYYDEVIEEYHNAEEGTERVNKIFAIPYGYIESIGIDTTPIKNDEVEAYATTYIKDDEPNYLYVYARVENNDSTPYYTCYNLKYSITDQEKEEFVMLHEDGYIQAPFFVQEISNKKTPVEAKVASLTTERYEAYLNDFRRSKIIRDVLGDDLDFSLLDLSVENQTFDVQIMTHPDSMIDKGEYRTLQLIPSLGAEVTTIGSNVLNQPLVCTFTSEELEKFQNNVTNITYYFSYNRITFKNYESELESDQ